MRSMKTKSSEEQLDLKELNSFKGTLIGVGVLALVMVIMWISVFMLYMDRV